MASLQSNPLGEDNMQEVLGVGGDYDPDDYEGGGGGPRRSHSHPGSRPNPPTSLSINPVGFHTSRSVEGEEREVGQSWTGGLAQGCAPVFQPFGEPASSSIPLTTPTSPGPNNKLTYIKNWTISTYKCSRQSLYEKLGKTSRTVDSELESQIEVLRETQRKYSNILRLARALTSHFYHVVQTQNSLGECFSDLAHKSPELQEEFLYNAETQRNLTKNGEQLLAALNFFVSSVNTIVNKTMEDSISTVRQYEVSRVEYDAYRSDLEYYATAPKTEVNQLKQAETLASFNNKKAEFEKLRSDVQIKLKFLDENRVKVMQKQLLLFHNAVAGYFSGNQTALDATMKQFAIKAKANDGQPPSWIEK